MLLATLFVATGCKEEKATISIKEPFQLRSLTHSEECKQGAKDDEAEYIEYNAINEHYLNLNHVNVEFTCCSEDFIVTSNLSNDTIYIYEQETGPICYCLCKYDLNYQVGPLENQEYIIKVYKSDAEHAEFTIDFNENTEGTFEP